MSDRKRFSVEHHNPRYNEPQYLYPTNVTSKKMFRWQNDAFEQGKDERFFLVQAFCGSGKSLLMTQLAIHDILKSKRRQKQLIIVPQEHIHKGFVGDKSESGDDISYLSIIHADNEKYEWHVQPEHNCCDGPDRVERLKKWLLIPASKLVKGFTGNVIGGINAVCTYSALVECWKKLSDKERQLAIKNLTLRVDEAHHIKHVFLEDEELTYEHRLALEQEATELGRICKFIVNNKDQSCKLHLVTATFYRGDRMSILLPMVLAKFSQYNLDWIEHFNSLGIKSFYLQYEEYEDDPVERIIARIKEEPNEKHYITVPSTGQKWRLNGNEYLRLISRLKEEFPRKRILDMVTPGTQKDNKKLLLAEPKNAQSKSKFDIVIVCMLGREGTDWCPCSRLHNASCENSITLAIQTLGRPFRRFEGKEEIKVFHYVKKFAMPKKGMTKRELLSDRINALLFCMQLKEMFNPIMIPKLPSQRQKRKITNSGGDLTLADYFGDQYDNARRDLIEGFEDLADEKDKNIEELFEDICDSYDISEEDKQDVQDGLLCLVLREIDALKMPGIDVAFLRESGFDRLEEINVSMFGSDFYSNDWEIIRDILRSDVKKTKSKILALARSGGDKPNLNKDRSLAIRFYSYTSPNHGSYDEKFFEAVKIIRPDWFVDSHEKRKQIIEIAKNGGDRPPLRSPLGAFMSNLRRRDSALDLELKKIRPDWFMNSSEENKKLLLEMAKTGRPRPVSKTKIGERLCSYIRESSDCFDLDFYQTIKLARPDWFVDSACESKEELLLWAKNNKEKPDGSLLRKMYRYSNPKEGTYDAVFTEQMKKLRPEWFENLPARDEKRVLDSKEKLLKIARSGNPKPKVATTLGGRLKRYTDKNHSSYDSVFDATIRTLRSDWFNRVIPNTGSKQQLLEIAKNGHPRPRGNLGGCLSSYTNIFPSDRGQGCYDPVFDREIRALRPDWFENLPARNVVCVLASKEKLLEIAKNGLPKPKYGTKDGARLKRFVKTDPVFAIKIRNLRPDWFANTSDLKKQQLLEMAKNGHPKPKDAKLRACLYTYTSIFPSDKGRGCYDAVFDKEIRELRPDWFPTQRKVEKL